MTDKPTIAYISQLLPNLTETFVYREIFALQSRGFRVVPLSIHAPNPKNLSSEAQALAEEAAFVFPIKRVPFLKAHAYFLARNPLKYLGTLLFVMTRRGQSNKVRQRTLYHFAEAIFLAVHVKEQGVQHVHAHFSVNAATIALVLARMLDITFSFTVHNNIFSDRLILTEKLQEAKFVATMSKHGQEFLGQYLAGNPRQAEICQNIHLIRSGIPVDKFNPPQTKRSSSPPIILSVAQLAERKGTVYLVEACHVLHQRGYAFRCIICGDGPQRPQVEHLIDQYQLHDIVTLAGVVFQEDLIGYLNNADIFAMACITTDTGDKDGIPGALTEAMAMELPVVSTYVSGIPELIDPHENGLLVPEKDATAFADALQQLLDDETQRRAFGKKGREKIVAEFNISKTSYQMAALLEAELVQSQADIDG